MTRLGLAAFAVVLATLLVPVAVASTWLSLRIDDTEAYVDTVAPLADDPQLRDALAEEVATAAVGTLEERVPAALLPDSLDTAARASAQQVVDNEGFPEFWRKANAKAHKEFLAIVHERDEGVVADGWVFIDIGPLLDQVLADFAADLSVTIDLPSQSVLVPLVPESKLEQARGGYQVLDFLSFWAPLLWIGLVGLAVLLAPGWRGRLRAGAACALGAAVGGVLVLLLTGPTTDLVVDQVDPQKQDLARLVVEVVIGSLDDVALSVVIGGGVVGAGLLVVSFLPRLRRPAPTY